MKRTIISLMLFMALIISSAGCSSTAKGTLEIKVVDAPGTATSIMITASKVEVHQADATGTTSTQTTATQTTTPTSGWQTISFKSGANPFDLIVIKGLEEVLATEELTVGQYTQIRMTITKVEITYDDGSKVTARVPSSEIKFIQPFQIKSGQTTTLVMDFDAEQSLVTSGAGEVLFTPVVKLSVR